MKTYKNLYPQITNFGNLYDAWRKARRGKPTVAFEQNLDAELRWHYLMLVRYFAILSCLVI